MSNFKFYEGLPWCCMGRAYPVCGLKGRPHEKELNNLSPADIASNKEAVLAADLKELKQLFDLGTFRRMLRKNATNIVD